jgi:hypothetical protein
VAKALLADPNVKEVVSRRGAGSQATLYRYISEAHSAVLESAA